MATIRLQPDFKDFLKLLREHKVQYLLIGGYAVGYHGYPRATADMDIWIAMKPDNAEKIVSALREFGFDMPILSAELFLKDKQIVRMGIPPVKLEIITSISGVEFDECYKERVTDVLDGMGVLDNITTLPSKTAPASLPVKAPRAGPGAGYPCWPTTGRRCLERGRGCPPGGQRAEDGASPARTSQPGRRGMGRSG